MKYDLRNDLDKNQFLLRAQKLAEKADGVVELTEKKPKSLNQNSYIHVCIEYLASQIGERADYVKQEYFKRECNPNIFVRTRHDNVTNKETTYLRSWADLTAEEARTAIDRFLVWSSDVCGVYIPSSSEYTLIQAMEMEIERMKKYI